LKGRESFGSGRLSLIGIGNANNEYFFEYLIHLNKQYDRSAVPSQPSPPKKTQKKRLNLMIVPDEEVDMHHRDSAYE
jgi:hypothetical protein